MAWYQICNTSFPRADSRFAPNQRETSLQSNAVSHWLGANLESSLIPWKSDDKDQDDVTCYHWPTVHSLWPSYAIWWHRSRSALVQAMACCLTSPSHYLNQCWLIINEAHCHLAEGNFTETALDVTLQSVLKLVIWKYSYIFQRGHRKITRPLICPSVHPSVWWSIFSGFCTLNADKSLGRNGIQFGMLMYDYPDDLPLGWQHLWILLSICPFVRSFGFWVGVGLGEGCHILLLSSL